MKQLLSLFMVLVCLQHQVYAQVAINTTGNAPNPSAMLDVTATNKGVLIPRMSTTARIAIATPAIGLMVYDSTTNGFWYYTGAAWSQVGAGTGTGWSLTGNAGTSSSDAIGTTDWAPLRFQVNGAPAGIIQPATFFPGNAALGTSALQKNTTGFSNSALGALALSSSTTASYNTAVGGAALTSTIGNGNTAVGFIALGANLGGYSNVAMGIATLASSTTDHNLVAIGDSALYTINNKNASYNTAIGSKTLFAETGTGSGNNTAAGYHALTANTTGGYNAATGALALSANKSGSYNTANGYGALLQNTASNNTAIGFSALAGNTTGNPNDAFGYTALQNNKTGSNNAAFGAYSLQLGTGSFNTAMGIGAISQITSGGSNTALGYNAGQGLTGGSGNIAVGANAQLPSASGSNQLSIGNWIYGNAGNISIGTTAVNQQLTVNAGMNIDQASANGSSLKNAITFGTNSGSISGEGIASNRSNSAANTNQYGLDFYTDYIRRMYITAAGNAGFAGSISIGTTAVNQQLTVNAGMSIDQASANGSSLKNAITFGTVGGSISGEGIASNRSNTAAGTNHDGLDFYTDYINRMSITNTGYIGIGTAAPLAPLQITSYATIPISTVVTYKYELNDQTSLSYNYLNHFNDFDEGVGNAGAPFTSPGDNGEAKGTGDYSIIAIGRIEGLEFDAYSDMRAKNFVDEISPAGALLQIMKVRPLHYTWKDKEQSIVRAGVFAQEMAKAIPEAVTIGPGTIDGKQVDDYHTVDYNQVTAVTIAAVQALNNKNAELSKKVDAQQAEIDELKKLVQELEGLYKK